jgi:hypothetical protein
MYDLPRWAVKPPLVAISEQEEEKVFGEMKEIS